MEKYMEGLQKMARIAKFQKVSTRQYMEDTAKDYDSAKTMLDALELPKRSTADSAGYDFYSPESFVLHPGQTRKVPLGVRCEIASGWVLVTAPRSGMGTKYKISLDCTLGIIDSDYFGAKNEGHIMAQLTNHGNEMWFVKAGDRILQGIFLPYGITTDDAASGKRVGGMGSTGE